MSKQGVGFLFCFVFSSLEQVHTSPHLATAFKTRKGCQEADTHAQGAPPERKGQGGASPGKAWRRGSWGPGIMRGGARRGAPTGRKGQVLTCRVLAHGAGARVALACSVHTSPGPAHAMPPDPGVCSHKPPASARYRKSCAARREVRKSELPPS